MKGGEDEDGISSLVPGRSNGRESLGRNMSEESPGNEERRLKLGFGRGRYWYPTDIGGRCNGIPGRVMPRCGGKRDGGKSPGFDWKRGKPRDIPKFLKAARRDREFIVDRLLSFPVVPPTTQIILIMIKLT